MLTILIRTGLLRGPIVSNDNLEITLMLRNMYNFRVLRD